MSPVDWEAIERSASILKMRVVVATSAQLGDESLNEARSRTLASGRLHVAVANKVGFPSRRMVLADTEPLVVGHPDAAAPADPQGLRTLSFAAGFRSGGDFAVVNIDRLEAAADNPDAPGWHRSVWAEILCPKPQALAVAAATISAVESQDSALAARVAVGLFLDRGLTEDEADRVDPHDGGLGSHLARLGLAPDDLVGVGRSGMRSRRQTR